MFESIKQLFQKRKPAPTESWQQALHRLGKQLVPPSGEADTLQGELVRCIANLRSEARRNGWMNWDVRHEEAIETLRRFLPEPEVFSEVLRREIHKSLDSVRNAGEHGADKGEMAYEELDFLAEQIVEWCNRSEELVYKKTESIWLDEDPFQESAAT